MRRRYFLLLSALLFLSMLYGCNRESDRTQIQVFVAASLNNAMKEIADAYNEEHPETGIIINADSSGKLMTQIEEGYSCDVFFSASQDQMNKLDEDGFLIGGTRKNILSNQLVLVTYKGSNTAVTGLADIEKASGIALADASVPVGRYTRKALASLGVLDEADDVSMYTAKEVSEALGGTEISERSNASNVLSAINEQSCEVGTVYLSDIIGHEDNLEILEIVSSELTGNIVYPVAQTVNKDADEEERLAASEFIGFILSDKAKDIFNKYLFGIAID